MTLALRYAVRSDRGLVRGNNEDAVYAGPRLLAIADGMGGHAAGEVASKIVIGSLERLDEDRPLDDLLAALRDAVLDANHGIADAVAADRKLDGMGTTLTALRFTGGRVGLVHIGDSRGYLMRHGTLTQITHDDTYVQSLVDAGRITAEEAASHPRKSVILRALTGTEIDPDISIREARPGDRYLLCTDGLSDVVTAQTLAETLAEGGPQECADRLVELALRGGGPDNVTCIVADVVEATYGDDVPVVAGAFVDTGTVGSDASPAERAARMARNPRDEVLGAAPRARRRHRLRRVLVPILVVAALVGASSGFYSWTQTQYFVGKDGTEVAIFRGVNTAFGPVRFFGVAENTDIKISDLTTAARNQIENGITAHSLSEARVIRDNLQSDLLPPCSTPTPTTSPSSTPSSSRSTASTIRTSAGRTTAPRRTPGRSASTSPASASPSSSPHVPVPGLDCR
ncbi:MAG: PP2C family serine/threonine-protein phosphatase [Actinomycetota bacterium]